MQDVIDFNAQMKGKSMKTIVSVLTILMFWMCSMVEVAQGQSDLPIGHLKKTNPNNIYVNYFETEDCGASFEQVINNELAQSRIKREEFWNHDELMMLVHVKCMPLSNRPSIVYIVDVSFGKFIRPVNRELNELNFLPVIFEDRYGVFGITSDDSEGQQFLRNAVRDEVEKALTDYLKVNFDL